MRLLPAAIALPSETTAMQHNNPASARPDSTYGYLQGKICPRKGRLRTSTRAFCEMWPSPAVRRMSVDGIGRRNFLRRGRVRLAQPETVP